MSSNTRPGKYPPGELRSLYRLALQQGWRVRRARRRNHWHWFPPDSSKMIVTHSTPCGGSGTQNARARLEDAGLITPQVLARQARV